MVSQRGKIYIVHRRLSFISISLSIPRENEEEVHFSCVMCYIGSSTGYIVWLLRFVLSKDPARITHPWLGKISSVYRATYPRRYLVSVYRCRAWNGKFPSWFAPDCVQLWQKSLYISFHWIHRGNSDGANRRVDKRNSCSSDISFHLPSGY